ncbi:unnamed protein product [Gordionus sp. m RMFG-2023]
MKTRSSFKNRNKENDLTINNNIVNSKDSKTKKVIKKSIIKNVNDLPRSLDQKRFRENNELSVSLAKNKAKRLREDGIVSNNGISMIKNELSFENISILGINSINLNKVAVKTSESEDIPNTNISLDLVK